MIHESAYVEKQATIGEGTAIWHFAHVRTGAKIGKHCNIGKSVYIDTEVEIGDNCKIQNFASLYKGLTMGNKVFIGPHVCFTNDNYPRAAIWNEERLVATTVKDGASIGANATIIAGVTIGKHALVGAGSVITKDVPDHGLVYGNPGVLKGFICTCGTKLEKQKETKEYVVFHCPACGQEIEVNQSTAKEVVP
jgi:UDP-2-acetamido-3-amino-2,3-dideoxy-glucuronate N-acetyltransferase